MDVDGARRSRERIERWSGETPPVPQAQTDMDRHVNRAWELARSDTLTRYVYPDPATGLVFIDKREPQHVPVWVVVTGRGYPEVRRK